MGFGGSINADYLPVFAIESAVICCLSISWAIQGRLTAEMGGHLAWSIGHPVDGLARLMVFNEYVTVLAGGIPTPLKNSSPLG